MEQPVVVLLFESMGTGSFTPIALHFSYAGLQFSSLVTICECKWLIFTCLKPESKPHIFDMASVPMAPRPCTSSFRQNKFRALLVRPEADPHLGSPSWYLAFPLPSCLCHWPPSGWHLLWDTHTLQSASLNTYMSHEKNFSLHC